MGWKMAVSMVSVPSNGMSEPRAVLFYLSLDTYINIALDMLVVIGSVSLLQSHTSTSLHVRMPYPRSSRSCNTPGGLTYRTRARGSRAPAATLNERSRRKPATEFECTSPWNVPSPYTFALELPTRPACVFRLFNSCCRAKLTFHCPRCVPHSRVPSTPQVAGFPAKPHMTAVLGHEFENAVIRSWFAFQPAKRPT